VLSIEALEQFRRLLLQYCIHVTNQMSADSLDQAKAKNLEVDRLYEG